MTPGAVPQRVAGSGEGFPEWGNKWIYAGILVCTILKALFGKYSPNADVVAYFDLSDAVLNGHWHQLLNTYWFPLYPILLAMVRSPLGHHLQYEQMAARMLSAALELVLVVAAVFLSDSIQSLLEQRGITDLVHKSTLHVWVAVFAYIVSLPFLIIVSPDALLSVLVILTVGLLIRAIARNLFWLYAVGGLVAGLAFLTKTVALIIFCLTIVSFAAANLRQRSVLRGLALCSLTFLLLAVPWISALSHTYSRLTIGDSGPLTQAWCVNGADRFNPVNDPTLFHPGTARLHLTHPALLVSRSPEIVFFDKRIEGTIPAWDDPSFWQEGLRPRFVASESIRAFGRGIVALIRVCDICLGALALLMALPLVGYPISRMALKDMTVRAVAVVAICAITTYCLVLVEGRYVSFALIILGACYASCCHRAPGRKKDVSSVIHISVVLVSTAIILGQFEEIITERRESVSNSAPIHGDYDAKLISASLDLRRQYPAGTEVACVGTKACWDDPYWARYARERISAEIETGTGRWLGGPSASEATAGCDLIVKHPEVKTELRELGVHAIIGRFTSGSPCSTDWEPLGIGTDFFYLPL